MWFTLRVSAESRGLRLCIDFNPECTTARDRSIPGRSVLRYLLARNALSTR